MKIIKMLMTAVVFLFLAGHLTWYTRLVASGLPSWALQTFI